MMSIQTEKDKSLSEIRPKVLELLILFKDTFCQTMKEEETFIMFSFIFWRSIYECMNMIEIDGKKGTDTHYLIK